jgi:hypothetical protein
MHVSVLLCASWVVEAGLVSVRGTGREWREVSGGILVRLCYSYACVTGMVCYRELEGWDWAGLRWGLSGRTHVFQSDKGFLRLLVCQCHLQGIVGRGAESRMQTVLVCAD